MMQGHLTDNFLQTEMVQDYINSLNVPKNGDNTSATAMAVEARKVREEAQKYVDGRDYKNLTPDGQRNIITQYRIRFIQAIEKEKIFYYMLAAYNPQQVNPRPVLVIQAPEKKDDEKKFLGYEWSNRKGAEGIHYLNTGKMQSAGQDDEDAEDDTINQILSIDDICTPLFNPKDLFDSNTINSLIRHAFNNDEMISVPEELSEIVHQYKLTDMLNFKSVDFDKVLYTNIAYELKFDSKYDTIPLKKIVDINPSKKEIANMSEDAIVSFVDMPSVSEKGFISHKADRPYSEVKSGGYTYFAENDIIIAKITPCMENGKCAIAKGLTNGIAFGSTEFNVLRCSDRILNTYLFALLNTEKVRFVAQKNMTGSSGHRRVPESFYSSLEIPLPPIDIQQKIAEECSAVNETCKQKEESIKRNEQLLNSFIQSFDGEEIRLSSVFSLSSGTILSKKNRKPGTIPVYGGNGITGYHNQASLENPTIVIGRVGEYCGSVHLTDGPAWITDNALYVTSLKIKVGLKYLLYALRYLNLNQYANRTGQPNISQSGISEVKIVIPDSSMQNEIETKITFYENEIASAKAVLSECNARKQAILDNYLK